MEQEFYMTILYLVDYSTQSIWNVCIKFDTWKEHWKLSVLEGKQCCTKRKTGSRENNVNRESMSLKLTIYLYRYYDEHEALSSCDTTL